MDETYEFEEFDEFDFLLKNADLDGIEWESGSSPASLCPGRDSPSTWMREMECMLMNDDGIEAVMEGDGEICGDFLDALCHDDDDVRGQSSLEIVDRGDLVDRGEVVNRGVVDQGDLIDIGELFDEGELIDLSNSTSLSNEKIDVVQDQLVSHTSGDDVAVRLENISGGAIVAGEDNDDDPSSKKRRRQLRNRDAAVKSRERKKMYVKDLEMKSRYLEAECKRLGKLLQCCYAENQVLRFSLHGNAYGAPLTKQESAVLLLVATGAVFFAHLISITNTLLTIPAVGFPALVPGHHVPAPFSQSGSVNPKSGCSTTGERRKQTTGKRGTKRSRK
ncbi:bZIP transcription factor 50-like protein [Drosera capensis]